MQNQVQTRLHYLDAVRAFALILGLVFHASLSFIPIYIGWAVMDINTSEAIPSFVLISHSFRMALFFLIAGYFSRMAFKKKGLQVFLKSRAIKIAIPLLIGWFLLRPLLVSGWVIGAESMRGEANILNGLETGFASLLDLPAHFLIGTHLWFLYYLLLITLTVVFISKLFEKRTQSKYYLTKIIDSSVDFVSKSSWSPLFLAIPTIGALWFMQNWGIDTPDKSLVPVLPVFILYGACFTFGWYLQRNPTSIENLSTLSVQKILLSLGGIVSAILLSKYEMNVAHAHFTMLKFAFWFAYAIMLWGLITLILGIFKVFFSEPNKIVKYLADASYWLYLIHLPLVIYLQIFFAEIQFHWLVKLVSILSLTLGISLLMYQLFVKRTFIGRIISANDSPQRK
jgi:peptidoglycan/LPS O-acetylase OafA/YrhL